MILQVSQISYLIIHIAQFSIDNEVFLQELEKGIDIMKDIIDLLEDSFG